VLSGRAYVRFNIVVGLYAVVSGNYAWRLYGETSDAGTRSANTWGLNVGVGYAY